MTLEIPVFVLVVAGLGGIVTGSILNVVVDRVPAGLPLAGRRRCPACGATPPRRKSVPILSWLISHGKCAACHASISVRYPLVELAAGLAFVGIVGAALFAPDAREGLVPGHLVALASFLYFSAVSIALTLIDIDVHRLPNIVVLPSYAVGLTLFVSACLLGADWGALLGGVIGMVALFGLYFTLRFARPDAMGGGDVKLAGLIGLYLGWVGWGALAVGTLSAFVLGGLFGLVLLASRRGGRHTAIPFGPWMILGAWTGIFAGDVIARWYVGTAMGS